MSTMLARNSYEVCRYCSCPHIEIRTYEEVSTSTVRRSVGFSVLWSIRSYHHFVGFAGHGIQILLLTGRSPVSRTAICLTPTGIGKAVPLSVGHRRQPI